MFRNIWQVTSYFVLSACLFSPCLSYAGGTQESASPSQNASKAENTPMSSLPKNSPWRKMNIFAQMTGIWEKPSRKVDLKSKSALPSLIWNSEQGAHLELSLLPNSPLGSAQKVSVQISGDFFSCAGKPLRLWFTTQEYIELSAPLCDEKNMLSQKSLPKEEKKLADIMNHRGFPVLLSQGNLAVILRSQLAPKEVAAMNWYRFITNPKSNKDLLGEKG